MAAETMSIAEASRVVGTVVTTLSVLTGALVYWRGRIAETAIKSQESEKLKEDLLEIQSQTSQLKTEVHSLKDNFSLSFQNIFHTLGRLEGSINAQNPKDK